MASDCIMMVMPCGWRISRSIPYLIDFARISASRTCYGASACRRDVAQICLQELKSSQQVSEHGLSCSINEKRRPANNGIRECKAIKGNQGVWLPRRSHNSNPRPPA